MSNSTKIQKADSKLTIAENLQAQRVAELQTAVEGLNFERSNFKGLKVENLEKAVKDLKKAKALLALRQWQMAVATHRETIDIVTDRLRRSEEEATDASERRTDAETQISATEAQIAKLQNQLSEAKAKRDAAESDQKLLDRCIQEDNRGLGYAKDALEVAEEATARAQQAFDDVV